jgi:hypothetical protein
MSKPIREQINIFLKPDEINEFWQIVSDCGFEKSPDGVKNLVFSVTDESSQGPGPAPGLGSKFGQRLTEIIEDHPAEIAVLKKEALNLIVKGFNKITKKK